MHTKIITMYINTKIQNIHYYLYVYINRYRCILTKNFTIYTYIYIYIYIYMIKIFPT